MTRQDTHVAGKKVSPDVPKAADARRVVGLLTDRGPMSIDELAHRAEFPVERVRETVKELEQRGHVATDQGFHSVDVWLINQPEEYRLRADGGQMTSPGAITDADTVTTIDDLTTGQVATILSPSRRRAALRLLDSVMQTTEKEAVDSPDPAGYHPVYVPVSDIAHRVEAARMGVPLAEVTSADHRRGYISMVQTHLGILDDYGVIEYYDRVQKVAPHPAIAELADITECIREWCGQPTTRPETLQWESDDA